VPNPKKARSKVRWADAVPTRSELLEVKRRAVLRVAGRAFSRNGFHNVSLDDIADSLNVTKPALYHYFDSKQELLYECHRMALDLGDASLAKALALGSSGLDKILVFLRDYVESLTNELGSFAVLTDFAALAPARRKEILARRDGFDAAFRGMVREGIADGSVRPCDPAIAVGCFMGAVNWLPVWFSPDGRASASEVAGTFASIFESGLRNALPPAPRRRRS
jgi:AcrR family transcriptional regulator